MLSDSTPSAVIGTHSILPSEAMVRTIAALCSFSPIESTKLLSILIVEGQGLELRQRGVAGPEVVKRDRDPAVLQALHHRHRMLGMLDQRPFGDFQLEAIGREAGFGQQLKDALGQLRVAELHRRDVDGDL